MKTFDHLANQILESIDTSPQSLAASFQKEFLDKYKVNHVGTHNCAWATQQFIEWAKKKGIQSKAIYFVWPEKEDNSGEAHIAPVVNNTIIDFTFRQFDKSFSENAKITPLNNWKSVYEKYGYGQNTVELNGKKVSVIVDNFETLKNLKEIGEITTIHPSQLK